MPIETDCSSAKSLARSAGSDVPPFHVDLLSTHLSARSKEIMPEPSTLPRRTSLGSASRHLAHNISMYIVDIVN